MLKFRMPFFPGQSLLLSTTVLNDTGNKFYYTSKLGKLLFLKKRIGIIKNYLNKMKILVMNSITLKIPK